MTVAVIVPSRGRPDNIRQLIDAWHDTGATAELHVMVDDDDPTVERYLEVMRKPRSRDTTLWMGPRRRLGGSLNHLAPILAGFEHIDVVGFMGDDHRPRTHGWDVAIGESSGPDSVVYGNDLIQGANLPTAVFLGATIVSTLGYFVPPGATHLYLDNYWKTLGEQLGTLRYLPEVIIEHMHPIAGKAEWDDRYAEVNSDKMYDADSAIYREWIAFHMIDAVAKIKVAVTR